MVTVHFVLMIVFFALAGIAFLHKYYKANVPNNQPQTPTGSFTEKFGKTQVILNIIAMIFGIAWFLSALALAFAR